MQSDEDTGTAADSEVASPPCTMHEADPAYFGLAEPGNRDAVYAWRRKQRKGLIGFREQLSGAERRRRSTAIAERLSTLVSEWSDDIVSVYWPLRGEPDLTPWMRRMSEEGMRFVLPVVVKKLSPLQFREWRPGDPMEPGIWNIPIPKEGKVLTPTIVIAPLVGYDRALFRLGHGGGYYDRTLAALSPRPRLIGVGYAETALPTIYPQDHDIPMDVIATEAEILTAREA